MKINLRNTLSLGLICLFTAACNDDLMEGGNVGKTPITLSGNIRQDNATRASDQGFVTGDRMGVYIVDYENGAPGTLSASGNRASNVLYTLDGEKHVWTAPLDIYWRDKYTPVDVYGYYPGVNAISTPTAYRFEVSWKQNVLPAEGEMSNYEASDLLWGKAEKIQPTTESIIINYRHQLAGVNVALKKGDSMTDTEWDKMDKVVQVDNTVRTCDFNLQTAELTLVGSVDRSIQMLPQPSGNYRAVVIPQTVEAGKALISITIDGKTYTHTLTAPMKYVGGKMHNFTLTVNKAEGTGDYTIALANDGITDWVNDEVSHSFAQNQYVVIDCPEPGKLKESITAAGYDYTAMQNLKVKGQITTEDFYFLRDEMPELKHLNLHDVIVKHVKTSRNSIYYDDALPESAFRNNETIRSLVLPVQLKRIGVTALSSVRLMYSTLVVPEGVTYIDGNAFSYNENNGMELVLPNSLDSIGSRAFYACMYKCELKLTDNIKYIGDNAFSAPNMYGVFHLPSGLKEINPGAFIGLGSNGSFTGEVEIPQGITSIGANALRGISFQNRVSLTLPQGITFLGGAAFAGMRFASLTFNDDLERIEEGCFYEASIPFPIRLPSKLREIGRRAFLNCHIEGELVLPENCMDIGGGAFAGCHITRLTLPSKMEAIGSEAFISMTELKEVTIPKYVDYIGDNAFGDCGKMQTMLCLNPEPPTLGNNPFGVSFDKCVLEVPESSVELYRNTEGWKKFKNITAHRELACNIPAITCMDKGITREGVVRSEGAWEVAECPSWVTVTPASSDIKKTEVQITVNANSGATREGRIVFRLKDHDYTTYTEVKQIAAEVKENQTVTLQTATAGSKAVPLFIVGEGYDAEDIASGLYQNDMKEQMEYFFSIEPLKTYRNYFTVSTAIACSPESGIEGERKFASENRWVNESDLVLDYARKYGVGIQGNEGNATILVLRNSNRTGENKTDLYYNSNRGLSVSWMAKSEEAYPFNQQGFILHELAGKGFGKLGPEYVNHFTFLKACGCPNCNMMNEYEKNKAQGWWQNVSISNKLTGLPWYHLIFDEKYAQIVDAYEGAINHSRGAYRSENASVMGNLFIPYFNTFSREILVRRIMEASGGKFDFEKFKQNDKIEIPE